MTILTRLTADTLQARKSRSPDATLMVTLGSDIASLAKNDGNREPNDADAVKVLRKFLGGMQETLDLTKDAGRRAEIERQMAVLQTYLPTQLEGAELEAAIDAAAAQAGVEVTLRNLSTILQVMSENHPSRVDGKAVSVLVKNRLA